MVWSLHFLSVDKSEEGPSPPQAARRRARAPWPVAVRARGVPVRARRRPSQLA